VNNENNTVTKLKIEDVGLNSKIIQIH
jgi:hypothetical protein